MYQTLLFLCTLTYVSASTSYISPVNMTYNDACNPVVSARIWSLGWTYQASWRQSTDEAGYPADHPIVSYRTHKKFRQFPKPRYNSSVNMKIKSGSVVTDTSNNNYNLVTWKCECKTEHTPNYYSKSRNPLTSRNFCERTVYYTGDDETKNNVGFIDTCAGLKGGILPKHIAEAGVANNIPRTDPASGGPRLYTTANPNWKRIDNTFDPTLIDPAHFRGRPVSFLPNSVNAYETGFVWDDEWGFTCLANTGSVDVPRKDNNATSYPRKRCSITSSQTTNPTCNRDYFGQTSFSNTGESEYVCYNTSGLTDEGWECGSCDLDTLKVYDADGNCVTLDDAWYVSQATCSCTNGVAATGAACTSDGAKCVSCDTGWTLSSDACVENTCTCTNGNGATGANCTSDGAKCASCDTGWTLSSDACVENTCTCNNGNRATGADCDVNNLEKCVSCGNGYTLTSDEDCCVDIDQDTKCDDALDSNQCEDGVLSSCGDMCTNTDAVNYNRSIWGQYIGMKCEFDCAGCTNGTTADHCWNKDSHSCSACNSGYILTDVINHAATIEAEYNTAGGYYNPSVRACCKDSDGDTYCDSLSGTIFNNGIYGTNGVNVNKTDKCLDPTANNWNFLDHGNMDCQYNCQCPNGVAANTCDSKYVGQLLSWDAGNTCCSGSPFNTSPEEVFTTVFFAGQFGFVDGNDFEIQDACVYINHFCGTYDCPDGPTVAFTNGQLSVGNLTFVTATIPLDGSDVTVYFELNNNGVECARHSGTYTSDMSSYDTCDGDLVDFTQPPLCPPRQNKCTSCDANYFLDTVDQCCLDIDGDSFCDVKYGSDQTYGYDLCTDTLANNWDNATSGNVGCLYDCECPNGVFATDCSVGGETRNIVTNTSSTKCTSCPVPYSFFTNNVTKLKECALCTRDGKNVTCSSLGSTGGSCTCAGDMNGDNQVNDLDLSGFVRAYNQPTCST